MKHWPLDTKTAPKSANDQRVNKLVHCPDVLPTWFWQKQTNKTKQSLNKISHSKREMEQMNFKNGFGIILFITIFVSFLFYDIYNT